MNNNLIKTFYKNIKELFVKIPYFSYLYICLAFVLIIASYTFNYIPLSLTPAASMAINFLLSVVALFVIMFLVCPILYANSKQLTEVSRFSNKKISLKDAFYEYYHINTNPYRIYTIMLFAIFFSIIGSLIANVIVLFISRGVNDGFNDNYITFLSLTTQSDLEMFLKENPNFLEQFNLYTSIESTITVSICGAYIIYGFKRNEATFFASNIIYCDNLYDIPSTRLAVFTRKNILNSVKGEHAKLDLIFNGIDYLILLIVYYVVSISFLFIKGLPYEYSTLFGIIITLLIYIPFYQKERIFEIIFYLAYADKMFSRVNNPTKVLISQIKKSFIGKDDNDSSDEDDFIDFTKKDK